MKHLILGSSGQIGSALTDYLITKGEFAIPFDIECGMDQDLRLHNNMYLQQCMEEADFVHFLAFDVGGSRYLKTYQHQREFLSNNVRLMDNVFEMLAKTKKPFIFASSQMSNMNYSPYGMLKALGEAYTKDLGGLIVKFWNVYGVEHDMEKSHVITDFIKNARLNRTIHMLTDGKEVRQFLHAQDCSRCLDILSQKYDAIPRSIHLHVTSFKWHSVLDIANTVAALYPGTAIIPAKHVDDVQLNKRNEPEDSVLEFWRPVIEIDQGIKLVDLQFKI